MKIRLPEGLRLDAGDPGHGPVRLDLETAQRGGFVTARRGLDGIARLYFAAPFSNLTIDGGELLTVEKTLTLRAALAYFAAPPTTRGDS